MVPWVYQAEINSLAMRTVGAASATATNWVRVLLLSNVHVSISQVFLVGWVHMHPIHSDRNREYRLSILYQYVVELHQEDYGKLTGL